MNEVTITLTKDQLSLFAQGLTALRLKLDEVAFSVQEQINAQQAAKAAAAAADASAPLEPVAPV